MLDHHNHLHEHTHTHEHAHEHAHEHSHEHAHEHSHEHTHEHAHAHEHAHEHAHPHPHTESHSHDGLLGSKAEAAAFITYTLSHNAHHEQELSGLVHSLQHLGFEKEAGEVSRCIEDVRRANGRLEAVLSALK